MGIRDTFSQKYSEMFLDKYGDRLNQVQGTILKVEVEEKSILGIFNKLTATLIVKPSDRKNIVRCEYKKRRWFRKVDFIKLAQGNKVIIQGVKGDKGKKKKKKTPNTETLQIMNIRNLTTKEDLVPMENAPSVQRQKAYKDPRYK